MNESAPQMQEDPYLIKMAEEDLQRGVSPDAVENDYGFVPTLGAKEKQTYGRAAHKDAEFICGCTVEVSPVKTQADEPYTPYIPPEHRPYRENLMTEEEKQTARRRLPEVRAILSKDN